MIDIDALRQQLAAGEPVAIVDVRGKDEYQGALGHIPGSLNIPPPELPARLARGRAPGRAAAG